MDYSKNAERVLNGTPGLGGLKNLRISFGSLDVSRTLHGKEIMTEIVRRIDLMDPDSFGAKLRRFRRKLGV